MRPKRKVSRQFLKLSREHALIWHHVESLEKALDEDISVAEFEERLEALSGDLAEHFALEEEVLFPAALMGLRDLDVIDQVVTLSKEHGYFERDFTELKNALTEAESQGPLPASERGMAVSLLQCFRQHARIETESLFQKMDESPACTKVLKGFLID